MERNSPFQEHAFRRVSKRVNDPRRCNKLIQNRSQVGNYHIE